MFNFIIDPTTKQKVNVCALKSIESTIKFMYSKSMFLKTDLEKQFM